MTTENIPTPTEPTTTPDAGTPNTPDAGTSPTETTTQLFPDNWQELISNNDEEKKNNSRYASPKEVSKALLEANKKISQRFDIKKPTETATEEEALQNALGKMEKRSVIDEKCGHRFGCGAGAERISSCVV
jgi:hypothetical protein